MSIALRYGASGSFFLATVLLGAAMFLPVEQITYREDEGGDIKENSDEPVRAYVWWIDGSLPQKGDNATAAGASWYDGSFSSADGSLRLRLAGPLVLAGTLTILVCAFLVLSHRGIATGWAGTAGLLVGGIGMLLLLLGINAFAKDVTLPNVVTDNGIKPDVGFWSMFLGLLVGSGAALASFNVKPPTKERIGPDGQPLPPLPVLSVENPDAFNPMASRDPRPFRQEEDPYMTYDVTAGPRKFRMKGTGEEEPEKPAPGASAPSGLPSGPPSGPPTGPPRAPPEPAPGAKAPASPAAGAAGPKPAPKAGGAAAKPATTAAAKPAASTPPKTAEKPKA